MTTITDRMYDSAIDAGSRQRAGLFGHLEHLSLWLVLAAYVTVYAVLLVGAAILAMYLGTMLPGMAGVVAFFTVGLALVAAAPTAARLLFTRALDALADRQAIAEDDRQEVAGGDRQKRTGDDRQKNAGPPVRPAPTESPGNSESTSDTILVVLDFDDPATTLRAVMGDPATADAEFHLLVVFPTAAYEARRKARIDAGVTGLYTIDHLAEEARRDAQRVGHAYLDTDGEGFEAMGAVGRTRDHVSEAVRTHDYGRVYVPERRPTVWQRLLGVGDLSSELVRVLPETVTVVSAADVLGPAREKSDAEVVLDPEAESTPRSTER